MEEALEVALGNLGGIPAEVARVGEGLYVLRSGDSYDATRLLLLDLVRSLEVQGEPVAMVPNRDTLLISGTEDQAGLALMLALAGQGLEERYALSGVPLILGEGGWSDWLPTYHPLAEAIWRARGATVRQRCDALGRVARWIANNARLSQGHRKATGGSLQDVPSLAHLCHSNAVTSVV